VHLKFQLCHTETCSGQLLLIEFSTSLVQWY